ncbi:MAG: TonB family protein [Candidatus Lokiarchaeota archaeon]|nr:TonB family protein [Candidatus Lokiarchaeota archaeon]
MPEIISALIGAFVALLTWGLSNKETRVWMAKRLVRILGSLLIITIFSLIAYLCFQQFEIRKLKNTIQTQKDGNKNVAIDILVDNLAEERNKYNFAKDEIEELSKEKDSLSVKIDSRENELFQLKSQLYELQKQRLQNQAKIISLKRKISEKENEIKILKNKEKQLTTDLQKAQTRLKNLEDNIETLQKELMKEKDKYIQSLERVASLFESGTKDTTASDSLRKVITWSADKKYLAIMYSAGNIGDVSIIDISSQKEVKKIPIERGYNQIKFSKDGKKIVADDDTLEIVKKLPPKPKPKKQFEIKKNESKSDTSSIDKKKQNWPTIYLRSTAESLSEEEVKVMIKKHDFYDKRFNKKGMGLKGHSLGSIDDYAFGWVLDKATGLMWQNGGSSETMNYESARKYITQLRQKKYFDGLQYIPWRLPTLEEAMSLVEPKENKDGLFINRMFSDKQQNIWTCDRCAEDSLIWTALFSLGGCSINSPSNEKMFHVRAVFYYGINEDFELLELPPPPPPSPNNEDPVFVPYDEPPEPIGGFAAIQRNLKYPEAAKENGVEGRVMVHVQIDEEGNVVNTKILVSLNDKECDEAAIAAIRSVVWKPALHREKPVKVWCAIPVVFKIK